MTTSVQRPEDAINAALVRIGYPRRVDQAFEGTRAARAAVLIYGQTRDQLLRDGDWGFAERNMTMALLKSAPQGGYFPPNVWTPAFPPLPWFFEYSYPADCLKVRAVKATPVLLPNYDPQTNAFTEANDDSYAPAVKVILCNVPAAQLVYTGRITDPTVWEPSFVEALIAALADRLAAALGSERSAPQNEAADEQAQSAKATVTQG